MEQTFDKRGDRGMDDKYTKVSSLTSIKVEYNSHEGEDTNE